MGLVIEPRHREYLFVQRGEVSDAKDWEAAYEQSIQAIYDNIRPHLPERCGYILDVGSGLGGIDILLSRHYGHPKVTLLDGVKTPAKVESHAKPFNDMDVAMDFLRKNGVQAPSYVDPQNLKRPYAQDLIVSFASWCFHLPPAMYLKFVSRCCVEDTVLILEVRKRDDWLIDLENAFGPATTLFETDKLVRNLYLP